MLFDKKNYLIFQIIILIVLLSACESSGNRNELTRQKLFTSQVSIEKPIPNRYFMPFGAHYNTLHKFSGAILIPEHSMISDPKEILPIDIQGKKTQLFPRVSLEFISNQGNLIPIERDIIIPENTDSYWQIQVSPGRVWSEVADGDMSRASFPFLLTSIIENESYNGIATFLYDEESISSLRYQIVSQLSPFVIQTHFVATGQTEVTYQHKRFDNINVTQDFERELGSKLPWRDWTELQGKFGKQVFENFDSGIDPAMTLTSGLVIDGEIYVRSMNTPFGPFP